MAAPVSENMLLKQRIDWEFVAFLSFLIINIMLDTTRHLRDILTGTFHLIVFDDSQIESLFPNTEVRTLLMSPKMINRSE